MPFASGLSDYVAYPARESPEAEKGAISSPGVQSRWVMERSLLSRDELDVAAPSFSISLLQLFAEVSL